MSRKFETQFAMNSRPGPEQDGIARLGAAILIQAYKDLVHKEAALRRKAKWFFISGKLEYWAAVANVHPDEVMRGYRNVLENGLPTRDA